ncbi:hypothetical protein HOT31_gp065 [Microbacterium phage Hendrix]|uniref:Uncharacterized protein n=1 Tax=Microbacterium phage Hendrix TaxID=2182341 RepID=A0A2U8UUQ0_9CAUD|nr:hypothetical protein HOT31_gp065 [Microbacterium phage Hendrix]AWN07736.1 hypothetical protein PBI_HENDRIX_65 [Microbacterium phage Hendrix]
MNAYTVDNSRAAWEIRKNAIALESRRAGDVAPGDHVRFNNAHVRVVRDVVAENGKVKIFVHDSNGMWWLDADHMLDIVAESVPVGVGWVR